MTWAHIHGVLSPQIGRISHHRLSFSDAAYGFVAISGIVLGMILTHKMLECGPRAAFLFTEKRLRIIYAYIVALSVIGWILWSTYPVETAEWSSETVSGLSGLISLLFLTNDRVPFWDILPMYLALVAISPVAILLFQKGHASLVIAISAIAWLLAQNGLAQHLAYRAHDLFGFPYHEFANPFVVWAWQFPFVVSLYLGFRVKTDETFIPRMQSWAGKNALALVVLFLVLAILNFYSDLIGHLPRAETSEAARFFAYESKWLATPIYMLSLVVNGGLLLYLCSVAPRADHPALRRIGSGVRDTINAGPFVALGRRSIQIFTAHLLILLFLLVFVPAEGLTEWLSSILIVGLTLTLLLVPRALDEWSKLIGRLGRGRKTERHT